MTARTPRRERERTDLPDLPPRKGSLEALLRADFLAHGAEVIDVVRRKHPTIYLKLVVDVLPQEMSLSAMEIADIGDEELVKIIKDLRDRVVASSSDGGRTKPARR